MLYSSALMKVIIAADIFGNIPYLHDTAHAVCENFAIVSPYEDIHPKFVSEEEAYASFLSSGGIPSYAEKLTRQINSYKPDAVIGFSAGATAGWIALSEETIQVIKLGVLFYGSRIRDYLHLRPCCKTKLFFAEHEQSFNPKQLVSNLLASGMLAQICADCQHGFMNKLSTGYDSSAEEMGINLIKSALSEIEASN